MARRLSDWVDPNIGTIGHLLTATKPLVHLPHSMAQVRPILDDQIKDVYLAPTIYGFPLNQASVMADVGENATFASGFDHDFEEVHCYRGAVLLEDSGVQAEYTVTERCALYRFAFPKEGSAHVRIALKGKGTLKIEDGVVLGEEVCEDVPSCFAATLSEAPKRISTEENAVVLDYPAGTVLTVKAGFSYIDAQQALTNLRNEAEALSFDEAAARAQDVWDETLGRIEVEGGTDRDKRIFYTSLYRVHQRMINISEYGRYYSGFDGKVHEDARDFYVNDGIWDTYRGAHPLQLILEPDRQMDIIDSYLRQYRQCGAMPTFPHLNGSRAVMIGKHSSAMIADTYMKGYRGFDAELAWEAMVKNADCVTKLPWAAGEINDFDRCYFEKGFFPALPAGEQETLSQAHPFERRQCVAVTLECCYDDWCLGQMGEAMGKPEAKKYAQRAQNYRNVFNRDIGFIAPRTADGKWVEPFDPKLSGGQGGRAYFAECNSWTYTMHVQHDVQGLAELLGGRAALAERLDRMFCEQYGTSKFSFLGQFPDSTGLIGQFCQGNEPSFHIPYMYNEAGQPWKTQRKVREIMRLWYDDTPLGICGDEDGGAMCAWFVFAAMGFYPACPGRPDYDLGSPVFDEVCIHQSNGKTFTLRAEGNSEKAKYIQSATLNGEAFESTRLKHQDILEGATLTLKMGERPNRDWAANPSKKN